MEMMEVGGLDDDVFFADLNKQISLLIMEDDDLLVNSPPLSLHDQNFPQYPMQHPIMPSASQFLYHHCHQQQQQQQISNCRREIKGTGVFIPLSSQPRRTRSKAGKNGSTNNNRSHHCSGKQVGNARGGLSPRHRQQVAYTPTSLYHGSNQNSSSGSSRYYY